MKTSNRHVLIPLIESIVFQGICLKSQVIDKVNEVFNSEDNFIDSETMESFYNGIVEKYNSCFYGISFFNDLEYIGFRPNPTEQIISEND